MSITNTACSSTPYTHWSKRTFSLFNMKGIKRPAPVSTVLDSVDGDAVSEVDQVDEKAGDENGSNRRKESDNTGSINEPEEPSQQSEGKAEDDDDTGKDNSAEVGGGAASGDPVAKRQKVEQLNEVPLVVPAAVCKDNKASLLVHLRDEALDFSGDTGAIGRISVPSKKRRGKPLTFDLKGQQFDGWIIPSATVMIVGVGRTEAKVEGVFSEVCRLEYRGNVLDSMGGEVLKGEIDESYKFEDEDVNVKSAPVGDEARTENDADAKESGAKTPKAGAGRRKASSASKRGPAKGSSGKKGTGRGKK